MEVVWMVVRTGKAQWFSGVIVLEKRVGSSTSFHKHPHSHTLTPTPSLPHPHSHTITPTPSLPHHHSHTLTPTPSLPHHHSHTLTPTPSLPHHHSHTITPTPSLPHHHSHTITPTPSLPHHHSHTITPTPSLPHHHSHTLTPTPSLPHHHSHTFTPTPSLPHLHSHTITSFSLHTTLKPPSKPHTIPLPADELCRVFSNHEQHQHVQRMLTPLISQKIHKKIIKKKKNFGKPPKNLQNFFQIPKPPTTKISLQNLYNFFKKPSTFFPKLVTLPPKPPNLPTPGGQRRSTELFERQWERQVGVVRGEQPAQLRGRRRGLSSHHPHQSRCSEGLGGSYYEDG